MRFRRIAVSLFAVGALVALASPTPADTFRVRATDARTWKPATKHISKGDRIRWKNPTNLTHTVTAYGGGWSKNSSISPGERTSFRFNNKGRYTYRCMTAGHSSLNGSECSGMCGVVHVM